MEVREYRPEDYFTVAKWFYNTWQNGNTVPECALPGRGFIVDDVCVVFVYATEAVFNCIGYPCINPDRMLDGVGMMAKLIGEVKKLGCCVAYPESEFLRKIYEQQGFKMINEYNKEMSYVVEGVV